jgi:hypothetical protein
MTVGVRCPTGLSIPTKKALRFDGLSRANLLEKASLLCIVDPSLIATAHFLACVLCKTFCIAYNPARQPDFFVYPFQVRFESSSRVSLLKIR